MWTPSLMPKRFPRSTVGGASQTTTLVACGLTVEESPPEPVSDTFFGGMSTCDIAVNVSLAQAHAC